MTLSTLFNSLKVKVLVAQSYPTLCNPLDSSLPDSSVRDFPGKNTGAIPADRPKSPALQAVSCIAGDSLPTEPLRKFRICF